MFSMDSPVTPVSYQSAKMEKARQNFRKYQRKCSKNQQKFIF